MMIPYRTARVLKRLGIVVLTVLLLSVLVLSCWLLWLQRFVVYTRDGAKLDLSLSQEFVGGEAAVPPDAGDRVQIYYNEGDNALNISKDLQQIVGYYADKIALEGDIDQVLAQIRELPRDAAVMVDVKSPKGSFFYSSKVSEDRNPDIETQKMDELIRYLAEKNIYAIARLPALRDYAYGLEHVSDGIPIEGGYLWADDSYCYWLNPARENVQTYLLEIIAELKALGFDEVVLDEFRIPYAEEIVYENDRTEVLQQAAEALVSAATDSGFTVSFVDKGVITLPEGKTRLYMSDVVAADVGKVAEESGITDPQIRIVFQTSVHDTRFDEYSVLRPLDAVQ
jgi:hypothetical protein